MKRSILLYLVPVMLIPGAVNAAEIYNKDGNKLDIYGKIDGLHYFSKDKNADGDQSYVRGGFRGETQIDNQITGYGQWEYNVQANNTEGSSNQSWTRLAFAGLKFGDAGSFDYGRNTGVVYDVTSWTDVLPEFGSDGSNGTYDADNFMQSRANGLATYRNSDFFGLIDGLNFALQYQGKNGSAGGEGATNNGRDALSQNGDGFGTSVTYDIGDGVSAGFAYSHSRRTDDQNRLAVGRGDYAETYTGGLKYNANNIYLATQFTQTYNATRLSGNGAQDSISGFANKAQNLEMVAQYQFDSGLQPSIAYLQSKGKNIEGFGDQDLLKYIDVGTTYNVNKNISTYVDYKINLLKNNEFTQRAGISTDNIVALGLVYQF
ncbi:MAG: porin OmpC [Yokenella regensburgei]|jgi:outer membrane pore protein C|uniref:Outer membrane pore protein C n=1 Tax=Yokenella regensburgei TaxID=158877 RepID=A0AB38FU00_9ENTR|nr:porin OmpC [Yokenella regensburgei]EHM46316.1 outer membrane protein [Yokenella regensburgei ATCC 43003]KAF1367463.1 outer membrane pore protein C [Yokenella regensburgei]KFD20751.1 outer membrane protein C [Yokenella regensburgei ATCC 49455]MDQ4427976.1 porin OmpC [Yokenella regensburgei]MDR3104794.1 porin OmpC [Yokenella regensburgei]